MKITFILKDLSPAFYEGRPSENPIMEIRGLNNLTTKEKFFYLNKRAAEKELKITMKVGNSDSFRDKVELNQLLKKDNYNIDYKLEARRGYKLVTFQVTP